MKTELQLFEKYVLMVIYMHSTQIYHQIRVLNRSGHLTATCRVMENVTIGARYSLEIAENVFTTIAL